MFIQCFLIVDSLDDTVSRSLFRAELILRWRGAYSDSSPTRVLEGDSLAEYRHRRSQCLVLEYHHLRNYSESPLGGIEFSMARRRNHFYSDLDECKISIVAVFSTSALTRR